MGPAQGRRGEAENSCARGGMGGELAGSPFRTGILVRRPAAGKSVRATRFGGDVPLCRHENAPAELRLDTLLDTRPMRGEPSNHPQAAIRCCEGRSLECWLVAVERASVFSSRDLLSLGIVAFLLLFSN